MVGEGGRRAGREAARPARGDAWQARAGQMRKRGHGRRLFGDRRGLSLPRLFGFPLRGGRRSLLRRRRSHHSGRRQRLRHRDLGRLRGERGRDSLPGVRARVERVQIEDAKALPEDAEDKSFAAEA
jgi:hypothetical protein